MHFEGAFANLHPHSPTNIAGLKDGTRDALTRYTRALTGAYYFVPSTESPRGVIDAVE